LRPFIVTKRSGEMMLMCSGIVETCSNGRFRLIAIIAHRPDRWDNIPDAASKIPGVWANLLTFLAGEQSNGKYHSVLNGILHEGPHNCIGFRFSLVECVLYGIF
jgi:hypothetical protein